MRTNVLLAAALASLIAGCVSDPMVNASADSVASQTRVEHSAFDGGSTVIGPLVTVRGSDNPLADMAWWQEQLISTRSEAAAITSVMITVHYSARTWHVFRSASFAGGDTAPTREIGRQVESCTTDGSCFFEEGIAVDLSPVVLTTARQAGCQIRLNAVSGDTIVVTLSAAYVSGFMRIAMPSGA